MIMFTDEDVLDETTKKFFVDGESQEFSGKALTNFFFRQKSF